MLQRTELIIVTTPATGAQKVAARAVTMARKSYLHVAGVIENMSVFVNEVGTEYAVRLGRWGRIGGRRRCPLLATSRSSLTVSIGGDQGRPAALGSGPAAAVFNDIARLIVEDVAPHRHGWVQCSSHCAGRSGARCA
ncbi:MAG: P-loop NTPase [Acidimicrobiales bacterium]